jgi:hypothetical protein
MTAQRAGEPPGESPGGADAGAEAIGDITRRSLLAGAAAAGGAVGAAPAAGATASATAADRTAGVVRGGRNALEVIGTLAEDGVELTGYGYLTRLSGVPDARLFAGAGVDRGEGNCRFTFFSQVQVTSRSVRPELFSVIGVGGLAIYFDAAGGGADFADPASFSSGRRIATYSARFHNVLTVIAPDQAMTTVVGQLEQRSAERFVLFGRHTRLGRPGLRERLTVTGPGRRSDPATPRAVFQVAGNVVVG